MVENFKGLGVFYQTSLCCFTGSLAALWNFYENYKYLSMKISMKIINAFYGFYPAKVWDLLTALNCGVLLNSCTFIKRHSVITFIFDRNIFQWSSCFGYGYLLAKYIYILLDVGEHSYFDLKSVHVIPSEEFSSQSKNLIKDTNREKARSNKTPAYTKSMTMYILVVGTSNQLFVRGF